MRVIDALYRDLANSHSEEAMAIIKALKEDDELLSEVFRELLITALNTQTAASTHTPHTPTEAEMEDNVIRADELVSALTWEETA